MHESELYCPLCNHRLYVRYEGWVCKNYKCKLFHKVGQGWVKYNKNSMLAKKNNIHTLFFNNSQRLYEQQRFAKIKQYVMLRDKYKCLKCGANMDLCVHHIIPVSEDANLSLDKDNMVTLCKKCHDLIHSCDKSSFQSKT